MRLIAFWMPAPVDVANRLKIFRESLGVSQAELCRQTGFSSAQWAQYETAKRRISLEAALLLNRTYGVTLDYIFLGDRSGLPMRIASKLPPENKATALKPHLN